MDIDNDQTVQKTVEDSSSRDTTDIENNTTPPPSQDLSVMLGLEELIRTNIAKIERLRAEYKRQNEMLESVLMGDMTYREHAEKAKEANKVKLATKGEIMKRPDVKPVAEKVKELKAEIKDAQESLSQYLPEYNRVSGQNQIEDSEGQIREIRYVAKLVKSNSSQNKQ